MSTRSTTYETRRWQHAQVSLAEQWHPTFEGRVNHARILLRQGCPHKEIVNQHGVIVLQEALARVRKMHEDPPEPGRPPALD
jgi:hypothetical protein